MPWHNSEAIQSPSQKGLSDCKASVGGLSSYISIGCFSEAATGVETAAPRRSETHAV